MNGSFIVNVVFFFDLFRNFVVFCFGYMKFFDNVFIESFCYRDGYGIKFNCNVGNKGGF